MEEFKKDKSFCPKKCSGTDYYSTLFEIMSIIKSRHKVTTT
jgi:hypothetical protein